MTIPLFQVDAFADKPFTGNPACVCLMEQPKTDSWLQNVAAEMNLSETAFVWRKDDHFHLRWFTPVSEVELCGHATLATSHILWESGWLKRGERAVYDSLSGSLFADQRDTDIVLDFPSKMPIEVPPPEGLIESLQIVPLFVGTDKTDYMIEVASESIVRNLSPNFHALADVTARGIIVTSKSDSGEYDFVSRFFAPAFGIDEDPVTGSAHTIMAPYWSQRLGLTKLNAFQASKRGGRISIEMKEDRVLLGGRAVTIFNGELMT